MIVPYRTNCPKRGTTQNFQTCGLRIEMESLLDFFSLLFGYAAVAPNLFAVSAVSVFIHTTAHICFNESSHCNVKMCPPCVNRIKQNKLPWSPILPESMTKLLVSSLPLWRPFHRFSLGLNKLSNMLLDLWPVMPNNASWEHEQDKYTHTQTNTDIDWFTSQYIYANIAVYKFLNYHGSDKEISSIIYTQNITLKLNES